MQRLMADSTISEDFEKALQNIESLRDFVKEVNRLSTFSSQEILADKLKSYSDKSNSADLRIINCVAPILLSPKSVEALSKVHADFFRRNLHLNDSPQGLELSILNLIRVLIVSGSHLDSATYECICCSYIDALSGYKFDNINSGLANLVRLLFNNPHLVATVVKPLRTGGGKYGFWHFFASTIIPILEFISKGLLGNTCIYIFPSHGPLSENLIELSSFLDIKLISIPEQYENSILPLSSILLPSYDYSQAFGYQLDAYAAAKIQKLFHTRIQQMPAISIDKYPIYDIIILDRKPPSTFYKDKGISTGTERRSIPNLTEVANHLGKSFSVKIISPEDINLNDIIGLVNQCKLLLGQHGAGLGHLIWMRPGMHVIEIAHPKLSRIDAYPRDIYPLFHELAKSFSLQHTRYMQSSPHSPINKDHILKIVSCLLLDVS